MAGRGGSLVYIEPKSVKALQETTKVLREMADTKGSKSLLAQMNKELRQAVEPMRRDIAQAAEGLDFERTSKQGGGYGSKARSKKAKGFGAKRELKDKTKGERGRGLRATMAKGIRTQINRGKNTTGIRVRQAASDADVNRIGKALDRKGQVRHPLFGDKDHWYATKATNGKGWFTETGERRLPWIRRDVEKVLDAWVSRLASRIDRAA